MLTRFPCVAVEIFEARDVARDNPCLFSLRARGDSVRAPLSRLSKNTYIYILGVPSLHLILFLEDFRYVFASLKHGCDCAENNRLYKILSLCKSESERARSYTLTGILELL